MIKAVIFDCFGVLITDALSNICNTMLADAPDKAQQVRELVRSANHGLVTPSEFDSLMSDILGITQEEYVHQRSAGEVKNEQLLAYILELRPKYKTAILSNITTGGLARRFSDEDLTKYFDAWVASAEVGVTKPEAGAYEYVARQLGVRTSECIFVDDIEAFCRAAEATGMKVVCYQDFTQMKGEVEALLANSN